MGNRILSFHIRNISPCYVGYYNKKQKCEFRISITEMNSRWGAEIYVYSKEEDSHHLTREEKDVCGIEDDGSFRTQATGYVNKG